MGEAGRIEQSSAEAKSLKTKAKGLSDCYSSEQQPRQPDEGGKWAKLRATLMTCLLKKRRAESSSLLKHKRAKGSPPKKSTTVKERRLL